MTEEQAERLIAIADQIAKELERLRILIYSLGQGEQMPTSQGGVFAEIRGALKELKHEEIL